jgi:hypothetical protein
MEARDLEVTDLDGVLRVIKALGAHRYVAAKKHFVHRLVLGEGIPSDVDPASRDERLWKACTEAEVIAVLERFWKGDNSEAKGKLLDDLERLDLPLPAADPFDESAEEDIHPVLIDCGWELVPFTELDPERHRGLIEYFEEPIHFESARFEEENAIPKITHLQELPVIGPRELLFGASDGRLCESLVVWCDGNPTYHEYILKGVRRAAKI